MHAPLPLTRDLVLIGGGHSHALVLRSWGMKPVAGVRLTLINPGPTAPYSGMLPGLVAGHYRRPDLEIDLVRLARFAGARLVMGRAVGVDREARLIEVEGRAPIFYDLASLDIGVTSDLPTLEGFGQHAVPAKPLGAFADRWENFVSSAAAAGTTRRVIVIGGGVAGAELAMACAYRLRTAGIKAEVQLLEAGEAALRDVGSGARQALMARIADEGVMLRVSARVVRVTDQGVELDGGEALDGDLVIGAAGARPQDWLVSTGLRLTEGFVDVGPDLRSVNDDRIFAVGDCAHLTFDPRPKAGVFAVREAPVLAHNLRAELTGGRCRSYRPQKDYLKLISTGGKHAIADKLGLRAGGAFLWRWKDHIDRKFMTKFLELPKMDVQVRIPPGVALGVKEAVNAVSIPCGGCAAKAGAEVLRGGLAGLPPPRRRDVLIGSGDDAAVLDCGSERQVITADQFRAFTEDPFTLARIAAVHAMGDIWAMGATPQVALATLILPRMRDRMQAHTLREIMEAASAEFLAAGADLVGGHTSVGAELTIGFTVTGLCRGKLIGLSGARPGDSLILTKPIGSGTLFAAEMSGDADGRDIETALGLMVTSQADASETLGHLAHAMTDVTGFGLAGHLLTMLRASGHGAEVYLNDIHFMPGVLALAAAGVRSSLYPDNSKFAGEIVNFDPDDARCALLLDPQTAGGLLAAVPAEASGSTLEDLRRGGYDAARIGVVTEGSPLIVLH